MNKNKFKYIYGPVPSWRLGSSLGIDLISQRQKICNFDCNYCQLGKTKIYAIVRKVYVPTEDVLKEIKMLPAIEIDYVTFSGRGEPTFAKNLGEAIRDIKIILKKPVAVLTNSSLMDREDIRKELCLADLVCAKLDAYSQKSLKDINNPVKTIEFVGILNGIKKFRKIYKGKFALQMMFVENNKNNLSELVDLINEIKPDEIQINTPLRYSMAKPLPEKEIFKIKNDISSKIKFAKIISVYDVKHHKKVSPISSKETLKRRGKIYHSLHAL